MISIKPKWVAKILNGEKVIEIRKTMPKCGLPIDVYIYCTKGKYEMGKFNSDKKYHEIRDDCCYAGGWLRGLPDETVNGKVVAKFTLNKIRTSDMTNCLQGSCLSYDEVKEYTKGKKFYGWAIDNLIIFDRPKELSEFIQSKRKNYEEPQVQKAPQSWCYVEDELE